MVATRMNQDFKDKILSHLDEVKALDYSLEAVLRIHYWEYVRQMLKKFEDFNSAYI